MAARNPVERILGVEFAHEGARALQAAVVLGLFDHLPRRGEAVRPRDHVGGRAHGSETIAYY